MTIEEIGVEIQRLGWKWWEEQRRKDFPNIQFSPTNMAIVGHAIGTHIKNTNRWPTLAEITTGVKKADAANSIGKLEFSAPDPKQNIPYQDKFPGVDSFEKWVRFVKTKKTSLADMGTLNALGAYLQNNNIRDNSGTSTDEADEVRQQREAKKDESVIKSAVSVVEKGELRTVNVRSRDYSRFDPQLQTALKSLDNLKPSDVGSVQQLGGMDAWGNFSRESGWSTRKQLDNFLDRVRTEVNQKLRSRRPQEEIADYITEEIREFTDSGIK